MICLEEKEVWFASLSAESMLALLKVLNGEDIERHVLHNTSPDN